MSDKKSCVINDPVVLNDGVFNIEVRATKISPLDQKLAYTIFNRATGDTVVLNNGKISVYSHDIKQPALVINSENLADQFRTTAAALLSCPKELGSLVPDVMKLVNRVVSPPQPESAAL